MRSRHSLGILLEMYVLARFALMVLTELQIGLAIIVSIQTLRGEAVLILLSSHHSLCLS